jgi:hypothetical protein
MANDEHLRGVSWRTEPCPTCTTPRVVAGNGDSFTTTLADCPACRAGTFLDIDTAYPHTTRTRSLDEHGS